MKSKISVRCLEWAAVINPFFLAIMGIACFTLSYQKGEVSIYLPLISECGASGLQIILFSVSCMISGGLVFITTLYRYLLLRYYVTNSRRYWRYFNIWNCLLGLFSACSLSALSMFPLTTYERTHTLIAASYFGSCLIYMGCDACLNQKVVPSSLRMNTLRIVLAVTAIVFGILFLSVYPTALHYWKVHNKGSRPPLKKPENEMFTLLFVSCAFEWIMYIFYNSYLMTFIYEFRRFGLFVEMVPHVVPPLVQEEKSSTSTKPDVSKNPKTENSTTDSVQLTQRGVKLQTSKIIGIPRHSLFDTK